MKKLPTILIDMDDVMSDLLSSWLKIINKRYGINRTVESVKTWHIKNIFKEEIEKGILTEKNVYDILLEKELWKNVKPIEGAQEAIKYLIDFGYDVIICTASDYRSVQYKFDLVLFKYFPFIDKKNIICTNRKELIKGDILIDDSLINAKSFALKNQNSIVLLFNRYHNEDFPNSDEYHNIKRVMNWNEVLDFINNKYNSDWSLEYVKTLKGE